MTLKLAVDNASCAQDARSGGNLSRSNLLDRGSCRGLDRHRMRVISTDLWAGWLHANFRNAEAVAAHFEVRFQTALNWWQGVNRPGADKVMIAALECPGFVEHLRAAVLADDAERRAA